MANDGLKFVRPRVLDCVRAASEVFGVPVEDVTGPRRFRKFMEPRRAAMHVARRYGQSFSHIGRVIGNRDHSTVIYAVRDVEHFLDGRDPKFARMIEATDQRAIELALMRMGAK